MIINKPPKLDLDLKVKSKELTVSFDHKVLGSYQTFVLGRKEIENLEPWTWIAFSEPYCLTVLDTYYFLLFGGIQHKPGGPHHPCFPVVLDLAKTGSTQVSLSDDLSDWYCPGSLENWEDNIKQDPNGFHAGLRLASEYETEVCNTILTANGLFIQKSLGKVSSLDGKEKIEELRYPNGLLMFYKKDD